MTSLLTPMTPEERAAYAKERAARSNKPTTGDWIRIVATFAVLGLMAYASWAGWFQ